MGKRNPKIRKIEQSYFDQNNLVVTVIYSGPSGLPDDLIVKKKVFDKYTSLVRIAEMIDRAEFLDWGK